MAKIYLEQLSALVKETSANQAKNVKLVCKHFFSGAALYANVKICMSLTPVGLAIKLPLRSRIALKQKGGKPLRYFPKGPIKKDYVVLPKSIVKHPRTLRRWMQQSIEYALGGHSDD